jgi:hypothetical protein
VIADRNTPERLPDDAAEDGSAAQPAQGPPAPAARPSATRRFAPLLLLAGAVAGAFTLVPHLPKERQIELRLDEASSIVDVELSFASSSDGEPVHGTSWHFDAGRAPTSLTTSVNLPDGRYEVDISVQRTQERRSIHRVISVGGSDQISIPVR